MVHREQEKWGSYLFSLEIIKIKRTIGYHTAISFIKNPKVQKPLIGSIKINFGLDGCRGGGGLNLIKISVVAQ